MRHYTMSRTQPDWSHKEIRIKPIPKPDVVMYSPSDKLICNGEVGGIYEGLVFFSKEKEREDTIKATFDGETGALKSIEMI